MQYIASSVLRGKNKNWAYFGPCKILLVIPKRAQAAEVWGNRLLKASELFGPMGKFPWIPKREIAKVYNSYSPAGPYPGKVVLKNGSELVTILSGDPNSWKGLEGMTFDMVIRDEVAGSENLGDELQPRLLASRTRALAGIQPWGGIMIWSATETKHNEEWLAFKQRCIDGIEDHAYYSPAPEEAEAYISMKAREEMKTTMSSKAYQIRGAGTLDAGDLVRIFVQQWDDKRHILPQDYIVKDDDNLIVSWDPGVEHPTGIVIGALTRETPNQIKIVKCFLHSNESIDYDVECIHSFLLGRRLTALVYDWAAKASHKHAPSLLHTLISKMDAKGYSPMAGYIQADKRVEPGIDSLRSALDPSPFNKSAVPLLVINPSQESGGPMLRSELMGYCKTEATSTSPGKVVKKNDDLCFDGETLIRMADSSERRIKDVKPGEYVATPIGPRRVLRSWMSSPHAVVKRYATRGGRVIVCTPGHRFLSNGVLWKQIDSMGPSDSMWAWTTDQKGRPFTTMGSNTTAIECSDIGGSIRRAGENFCTVPSTGLKLAQSRTAGISTIKTAIHSITPQETLWRCRQRLTGQSTQSHFHRLLGKIRPSGIARKRGVRGTEKAAAQPLLSGSGSLTAKTAESMSSLAIRSGAPCIVRESARARIGSHLELITSREIAFIADRRLCLIDMASRKHAEDHVLGSTILPSRPVYDLEVEGAHCFYANDLLAHNCDATRYLVRSFPYWSAAYRCGPATFAAEAPLQSDPVLIHSPNAPKTPMQLREELSRKFAQRSKASVRAMFMPKR
jgi:hypothetical protein